MQKESEVRIEIGERVLESLLRLKVPGLRVRISEEAPEIKISYSLLSFRFKIEGTSEKGELVLSPAGAAGKVAGLFKGEVGEGKAVRMAGGKLYINILSFDIPLPLKVESVLAKEGRLLALLKISS